MLDTLARLDVPATFFVLGKKIAEPTRRVLTERAHAEGHWIANHTSNHDTPLGRLSGEMLTEDEIGRAQDLIGPLAHPDNFFRPFGGQGELGPHLMGRQVAGFLQSGGYTCVLWNVIPRDWDRETNATWPETAMEITAPLSHALIVFYDLPTGAMDHLEQSIKMVRDAGRHSAGTFRRNACRLFEETPGRIQVSSVLGKVISSQTGLAPRSPWKSRRTLSAGIPRSLAGHSRAPAPTACSRRKATCS